MVNNIDEGICEADNFKIVDTSVTTDELNKNDVLVQVMVMSPDPFLRLAIRSDGTIKPGQVMTGFVAGKVLHSKNSNWKEGDFFGAKLPFSTFQIIPAVRFDHILMWKLNGLVNDTTISHGVSIYGLTGAAAYAGLVDVLSPTHTNQTLYISGASGAVGGLAGLIAKNIFQCTTIGSCCGGEKMDVLLNFYGFDHAIDCSGMENNKESLCQQLKQFAPDGLDYFFDNVGGCCFESAFCLLNDFGKIALCGDIADYCSGEPGKLTFCPLTLVSKRQTIRGFMAEDYIKEQAGFVQSMFDWVQQGKEKIKETVTQGVKMHGVKATKTLLSPQQIGIKGNFLDDMHSWMKSGHLKIKETPFYGIEQWPTAFNQLFCQKTVGKTVVYTA